MNSQDYKEICDQIFDDLFVKARQTNESMFLTSFFPFYNQAGYNILSYIPDFEFAEVLDLINYFNIPDDNSDIDRKTKTRIRLL